MSSIMRVRASAVALGVAVALTSAAASHAAAPGSTVRVSVATDGSRGEYDDAREPAISADGRYVVFGTADRLAENDTDHGPDVYLHDAATGVTELVSVGPDGRSPAGGSLPAVSADGRFVVFVSDAVLDPDDVSFGATYLRDRRDGRTTRVGPKNFWWSGRPRLSADGRFVVLVTSDKVVPGSAAGNAPAISGDGLWVTYAVSRATYQADVLLWQRATGATTTVSATPPASPRTVRRCDPGSTPTAGTSRTGRRPGPSGPTP